MGEAADQERDSADIAEVSQRIAKVLWPSERQETILVRDGKADVYYRDVTEWQCTCGAWVPMAYGRHPHLKTTPAAFADLHAARIAQEAGLSVPDATEGETVLQYVWRTPEMPTR